MSDLENKFKEAVEMINTVPVNTNISDDVKLAVYGLYKQAKNGDCDTEKPGFLQLTSKAKWSAWKDLKGMDKDEAKQKYVDLLNENLNK